MEAFFTEWVRQEGSFVSALLAAAAASSADPAELCRLVSLALAHVESYYAHKSRLAERDVVQAFYPRYLTPFERTFLWLGGFKPTLLFRLVPPGQTEAVARLRRSLSTEERDMSKQMASLQERLAAHELLEAMRTSDLCRNGDNSMERAASEVGDGLRALLGLADRLRLCTLRGIIHALKPADAAMFVANAMKFHLNVRRFGLQSNNRGD